MPLLAIMIIVDLAVAAAWMVGAAIPSEVTYALAAATVLGLGAGGLQLIFD